ncbi:AraC family transcriptional regulator [Microbacterium sp. cx-55]|uniref:helix-turn-helix transcriptional regulator n=1 Tax=Microbacterium sp. cx-55 TaxID=2875948 RepID=UPI001CBB5F5D|nr:helix-turn-helix transcriptional regulator [Microbacterium sp. cx-55]MBZ4485970.1 AraC family transcriptional regulator [Microbacterium sp. cx-55]UGB34156.1 AraC family transcriptional regulator [Microbacterium sp. cx-55]
MNRVETPERDALIRQLAAEGLRWADIARRVGVSERHIYVLRRRLGIGYRPITPANKLAPAVELRIAELWADPATTQLGIATEVGVGVATIQNVIERLDLPYRRQPRDAASQAERDAIATAAVEAGRTYAEAARAAGLRRIDARRLGLPPSKRGRPRRAA